MKDEELYDYNGKQIKPIRVKIGDMAVLWAGVDPDGNAKPIKVDKDGYVLFKKEV